MTKTYMQATLAPYKIFVFPNLWHLNKKYLIVVTEKYKLQPLPESASFSLWSNESKTGAKQSANNKNK